MTKFLLNLILWLLLPASLLAQCYPTPPTQSSTTFPAAVAGRLIYHAYKTYGDGSSHLYLYDFTTKVAKQLDQTMWGITDPMNADWSPSGKYIVFTGVQNSKWQVFLWQV